MYVRRALARRACFVGHHVAWAVISMSKAPRDLTTVRESLERIARSLGQPVTALFDGDGSAMREVETLALIRAFERITDRQARARCIAFVNAQAEEKA